MPFDVSIVTALLPVFAVILTGYGLRKAGFPGDSFWSHAERLTYFILFPALLLQKTASAPLESQTFLLNASALALASITMTALLFLPLPWWRSDRASFTSFFQGSIRFNTYVGLAAAYAIFGSEGLTTAALTIAVLIPLLNIICVSVLILLCAAEKKGGLDVAVEVMRNPLVLACVAGILLNTAGVRLHTTVNEFLLIFSRAALPVGLLSVGAGLSFTATRRSGLPLAASSILKLMVFPVIMWTACRLLGVNPLGASIAVLFAALPGSPAAYILSKQLGGNSMLMASIITVQTPLSMLSIPIVMAVLSV